MAIQITQNFSSQLKTINNALYTGMNRTFYVDAINGDDNNPGTNDAPFKTIKKAIDSVPVGGFGTIILQNSQTHIINTWIEVKNKSIYFRSKDATSTLGSADSNSPIILFDDNGTKLTGRILTWNSTIQIAGYVHPVKIQLGKLTNTIEGVAFYGHWPFDGTTSNNYLSIAHTSVDISDGSCYLFAHFTKVGLRMAKIKKHSTTNFAIGHVGYGTLAFQSSECQIYDLNNNDISTKCISGIVRDSNGIPRNVISNIIL
ncbi:MAG: hypothetical protein ABGW55_00685 [Nitrosopumilus sp.]